MWCLLFGLGCCGTGVEGKSFILVFTFFFKTVRYKSRGRFFENLCRFLAPHVAVGGWEEISENELPSPAKTTLQSFSRNLENKCRFRGSKVAVGGWEEFSYEIWLRIGASWWSGQEIGSESEPWMQNNAYFCRVASLLMPLSAAKLGCGIKIDVTKEIIPWDPYFFRSPMIYPLRRSAIFLPEDLIFSLSRDLPLEGDFKKLREHP